MTPLPVNPNITVKIDPVTYEVVEIATNFAPDVKVTVVSAEASGYFNDLALGKTFRYTPEPVTKTNC